MKDLNKEFKNLVNIHQQFITSNNKKLIDSIINKIRQVIKSNKKLIFIGNGGSAAEAQHMAAEYVSKFRLFRKALAAISLTVDTSSITSISNDFGFEHVFERQLEALGQNKDLLIYYSTSGKSKNIIKCVKLAKKMNIYVAGFTGIKPSKSLLSSTDYLFKIPSAETPIIQTYSNFLGHYICEKVESSLFL